MDELSSILAFATVLAPIIAAVVQAVKAGFSIPATIVPLLSIAVGALIGSAAFFFDADLLTRLWAGGLAGLAGTGFYELITPSKGKTGGDEGGNRNV